MRLPSLVVDKINPGYPRLAKGAQRLKENRARVGTYEEMAGAFWLWKARIYRFMAKIVAVISLILLLGIPAQGLAQSQFAGVYTGTFFSGCDPEIYRILQPLAN